MGATPHNKRVSDADLLAAYQTTGNVWKTAEIVGLCGQSVHERLIRMGRNKSVRVFSKEETDRLKRDYAIYRDANKLDLLAKEMGRTKHFLCRKARDLGLTDPNAPKPAVSVWKYMPEEVARAIFDRFLRSRLGLGQFCAKHGYDDLGFSRKMKDLWPDEYELAIEIKVPKQSRYRLGRAFEYRTRDHLKALGFFVMRSPQSKSPVDLLAVKTGVVLMVQCKRGGTLPVGEWNTLFDLAESVSAIPIVASSPAGRGVVLERMTARKDGSKRRQPKEEWVSA